MQRYCLHFLFCFGFLFLCFYSDPAESQGLYTLEEIPSVVARLNEKPPQAEYMRNAMTYNAFLYKDPKLPSWITVYRRYKAKYGSAEGLYDFMFPDRHTMSILYALEAVPLAVADLNSRLPEEEQIKDVETYNQFHHRDLKLPSWTSLVNWFTEAYGEGEGLLSFVLSGKEPYFRFYDLDEIPSKVIDLNARSPEAEQMRNITTYEEFRYKDRKLPSWGTLKRWYKEEHGDTKGLSDLVFSKGCEDTFFRS